MHVLTSRIPAMRLVLPGSSTQSSGEDPSFEEPNSTTMNRHAFQRFMDVFRSFLRAVATPEQPVVLFLDDLQWADEASRQLIVSLATDRHSKNMLLIGATRQGEKKPFSVDGVGESLVVHKLTVGPLSQEQVNVIVGRATKMHSSEQTNNLSGIV